MKIIPIDPSSTRTGYAVMTGTQSCDLIDFGLIKPKKTLKAHERVRVMTQALESLIETHEPDLILIEMTSGKVNRGRNKGGGAGQSIYGYAVGHIAGRMEKKVGEDNVDMVFENDWTRGRSKEARAQIVRMCFSKYLSFKGDSGLDVADAIGIGLWWLEREAYTRGVS